MSRTITPDMIGVCVPAVRPARLPAPPTRPVSPAADRHLSTYTRRDPDRGWRSGFCGGNAQRCADRTAKCPGTVRNGANAAKQFVHCACQCHIAPMVEL